MGNRAVIQFGRSKKSPAIYLHWNGGIESVQAFLDVAKDLGCRPDDYGVARLAQIIGNFFGGTLSIGVDRAERLDRDNFDNGTFVVKDWKIVKRLFVPDYRINETMDMVYYQGVYDEAMRINKPIFGKTE